MFEVLGRHPHFQPNRRFARGFVGPRRAGGRPVFRSGGGRRRLERRHRPVSGRLPSVLSAGGPAPGERRAGPRQESRGGRRERPAGGLLGDDTVPSKGWLHAHHGAAARRPDEKLLGVIGYTDWHPRMKVDPFLRYINEYGLQFGYALIADPDDVPFNFLYTSNLSLPAPPCSPTLSTCVFPTPPGKTPSSATACAARGCAWSTSRRRGPFTTIPPACAASWRARRRPAIRRWCSTACIPSSPASSAFRRRGRRRRRRPGARACSKGWQALCRLFRSAVPKLWKRSCGVITSPGSIVGGRTTSPASSQMSQVEEKI